jgi:glutamyl-tRNA synthetase/glutamyl-Q tRNA(Asp) synthetase
MQWLWAVADALDLTVIVRMEDHDRTRCTPGHERAILDEIDRLGFRPDPKSVASLRAAPPSPFRQSDHPERYQAAYDRLATMGLLYGCTCTRGDLPPPGPDGERRYPGTCRGQPLDRGGQSTVRVMLPERSVSVTDLLLGGLVQHPARDQGDPVIRDALGQWSYTLCVVVDDIHDDVGVIIRGEDLLSSTGRQWLLAELLGRPTPPLTLHHPLVLGANGRKLSKRDQASERARPSTDHG